MNASGGLVEVRVPDMGSFKDVAVIDVLVKPGERIEVDAPLLTLESDKATMDVPSTAAGVIEKIHTGKGGKVNTGDLIVTVRSGDARQADAGQRATSAAPPAQRELPTEAACACSSPAYPAHPLDLTHTAIQAFLSLKYGPRAFSRSKAASPHARWHRSPPHKVSSRSVIGIPHSQHTG